MPSRSARARGPTTMTPRSAEASRRRTASSSASGGRDAGATVRRKGAPALPSSASSSRPAGVGASGTGASGSRKGTSRCTGPRGTRDGGGHRARDDGAQVPERTGARLGDAEALGDAGEASEQSSLRHGLGGGEAVQLPRPVRGERHQRHARRPGLDQRRKEVRARRCPEVTTTAAGWPDSSARPRAKKPATRSSSTTQLRSPGPASATASASGALRDPGQSTTSRTPPRSSSCTIARDQSVLSEGMPVSPPPRRRGA